MTATPKDPQVTKYIEGMRAWRAELEALRPVLLGAGLSVAKRAPTDDGPYPEELDASGCTTNSGQSEIVPASGSVPGSRASRRR